MKDVYEEINETYEEEMKRIKVKYDEEMKEIDEKYDKLYYESLKVGAISGITTYTILRMIQKFT